MEKNQIVIGILSLSAIFIFLFGAYYFTSSAGPTATVDATVLAIKPTDHIKWASKSKNVLVEYSDLQCPACKYFHDLIQTMEKDKSADSKKIMSNITFVQRHYPLSMHSNSSVASFAAEAAGEQGKFFQMADILFNKQTDWEALSNPENKFKEYAKSLKLNEQKYNTDYKSSKVRNVIAEDLKSGDKAGVDGTPTFFLNGQKVTSTNFEEFKKLLLRTINK